MELYQSTKYPVIRGGGCRAALCTVWNAPHDVARRAPNLLPYCDIVGSLYTRAGVSAVIRNLAIRQAISGLYVWDRGPLSRNETGRAAADILRALWRNGIADDGTVIGTSYKFEPEMAPAEIRRVIADVVLIEAGVHELAEFCRTVANTALPPAARPSYRFPEPEPTSIARWPSETAGWLVRGRTIIEAWRQVVAMIMRYGIEKGTQYGQRAREIIGFSWIVTGGEATSFAVPPDWPAELTALTGSTPDMIASYLPTVLEAGHGLSSYGHRLRAYPKSGSPLDQVSDILVRNLRESPDSRRAVATTMIPGQDWNSREPPCLTTVQCLNGDGRLHLIAVLRSHDIFKGAIPNAVAMSHLQKRIADQLGASLGELMILSSSAHIYESDWTEALKVADCAAGTEADAALVPERYDPRGNLTISVSDGLIACQLRSPDGADLWSHRGRSVNGIIAKVAQLRLLSDAGHLMYLGAELARAEAALRSGRPYIQDAGPS